MLTTEVNPSLTLQAPEGGADMAKKKSKKGKKKK
jgi:hypothetical protein